MTFRTFLAGSLLLASVATGVAQDKALPAQDNAANGGAGIRSGNITSTGATVPNPGASQGAGVTSLDKGIQERDNKVDSGICKGC